MDFSIFKQEECSSEKRNFYSIRIGDYMLSIYLGEWHYTQSLPIDASLPLQDYDIYGIEVSKNKYYDIITLDEIGINGIVRNSGSNGAYNVSKSKLEEIYNKLFELSGVKVSLKEAPCKRCGKMNDIGAPVCWSFNCGIENPTK
jgi:hypothetical protein